MILSILSPAGPKTRSLFLLVALSLCIQGYSQKKTVGLTKKLNGNDENGYILFTPMSTDTTFLINKCGQRLHSWRSQYTPGLSVYLKPNGNLLKTGTYTDTVFGFAGGRGGIIEEFDWDNNLVWRYKLFNDSLCQHHDITPMPNGNILVLAWHMISKSKAMGLGRLGFNFAPGQNELWGERIIELKPVGKDSAEIVWEWDLFDHLVQEVDTNLPNYGVVGMHPELMNINYALNLRTSDWIHANSLDYNQELDQIVMSSHNISEVWILDHSTTKAEAKTHLGGKFNKGGDFLYRWGNPEAYDWGTSSDRKLFRQHNARWIPNGYKDSGSIMIFNNGWNRDTAYSSIDVIKTPILSNGSYVSNLPYGPANPSWIYKDSIPTKFYSQIISGSQRLPNGNTLICSGVQGRFFEVTPAGKTVWEYKNPVNATNTQMDGQTALNNAVFRCEYYPATYSAFKNRTLISKGPIEKNSHVYSCIYETVKPKIVAFSPAKNDTAILTDRILKVSLDEAVVKKNGDIRIYQNNVLYETISIHSDMVKINGKDIMIDHFKPFSVNSRVSVSITKDNFRDSSNNELTKGIDTSEWSFNTIRSAPKIIALSPAHQTLDVRLDASLEITFQKPVVKNSTGSFAIYQNSVFKESIPVSGSRVEISGNKVRVKPSGPFDVNTLVVVSFDSCFVDSLGVKNSPIVYGNWYFRTANLPKVLDMKPALREKDVNTAEELVLEFSRPVSVSGSGDISIFENGILKETIPANDARVSISGSILTIDPLNQYAKSSRIAVMIPGNTFRDTFGLFFSGLDSSEWNFNTSLNSSVKKISGIGEILVYPNPAKEKLNINMHAELGRVEFIDLTGRRIEANFMNTGENLYELDITALAPGHYVLLLNGSEAIRVQLE